MLNTLLSETSMIPADYSFNNIRYLDVEQFLSGGKKVSTFKIQFKSSFIGK